MAIGGTHGEDRPGLESNRGGSGQGTRAGQNQAGTTSGDYSGAAFEGWASDPARQVAASQAQVQAQAAAARDAAQYSAYQDAQSRLGLQALQAANPELAMAQREMERRALGATPTEDTRGLLDRAMDAIADAPQDALELKAAQTALSLPTQVLAGLDPTGGLLTLGGYLAALGPTKNVFSDLLDPSSELNQGVQASAAHTQDARGGITSLPQVRRPAVASQTIASPSAPAITNQAVMSRFL